MAKIGTLFGLNQKDTGEPTEEHDNSFENSILQEEQQENLDRDIDILDDEDGSRDQQAQKVAAKEVQRSAEDSLKKMHLIRMGRCPACGEHLRQHLFATICEACGWHNFDMPKNGPVRVHLRNSETTIEGDRCYGIKTGSCLILKDDLVVAKIPREAYDWIEYVWSEGEIDQRHKQVVERMQITCGWCNEAADPEADGFHMVHIAFGATQERYCFCCDACYEAFRKMFPSRVHRNCYERNCADCNDCVKRYGDDAEGIRKLAKDYIGDKKKR